jgi:fucose permease
LYSASIYDKIYAEILEEKIMMTALLIVIFISFISVGLPDSVLGTAWPVMYRDLNLPISLQGYISSAVSIGTIISSLLSSKLILRLGTGLLTAVSVGLTAFALLGFSLTYNPAFFFVMAVPLGIGAGAVDTALNSFVALHYSASTMSFFQCFYGLGVSVSPFIVSLALKDNNWRQGYLTVSVILFVICVFSIFSLPLWNRVQKQSEEKNEVEQKDVSLVKLLKRPAVVFSCVSFFFACSIELTAGSWSSSFFVNTKGVHADEAALMAMLFYIGLTGGRFLSGVLAKKLNCCKILYVSFAVLAAALVLYLLPFPIYITFAALFFIGLGVGPIFPNLVYITPILFGKSLAQSVMSIQMASTYVGIMVMPWLFGVLAQRSSTAILPLYLMAMFVFYAVFFIMLMKKADTSR